MVSLIICGLALVLLRVVQLKLTPDPRMAAVVGTAHSSRPEMARRGALLDRRGRIIATSTIGYRLFIDPFMVDDVQTIAVDIAFLIGADPVEIDKQILARPKSRYIVVSPLLEDWQVDAVRSTRLRGVGLKPRLVRQYPDGDLAAGLIGLVGRDHTGLSGLEHRFEDRMVARSGRLTYLRDSGRRALWVDPAGYRPGRDGQDVMLSIDLVVQRMTQAAVDRAVLERNAGGGRAVVMDSTTGEILAMYDVLQSRDDWDEEIVDPGRAIHPALGRNRCVTDPYEPGSTFKPFVWSVATHLGVVTLDEVLDTPTSGGHRTKGGRRIRDSHYYPRSTWREVLVRSLNSGMAIAAERMTPRQMQQDVLRAFSFGDLTGSGIPGESRGIVTRRADWTSYSQTSVAMGHEIAVTPLQMVRAFSAFARDGTIPTPRLTPVRDEMGDYRFLRRAIPESVALTTRRVMGDVMNEGTGRRAQSSLYSLFGKSGTAQLPRKEGGGYHEHRYVSSFIAGAPIDAPRLVVICVIDDPDRKKGHWGGDVAGPVVRDIIDGTLQYLGVPPDLGPE